MCTSNTHTIAHGWKTFLRERKALKNKANRNIRHLSITCCQLLSFAAQTTFVLLRQRSRFNERQATEWPLIRECLYGAPSANPAQPVARTNDHVEGFWSSIGVPVAAQASGFEDSSRLSRVSGRCCRPFAKTARSGVVHGGIRRDRTQRPDDSQFLDRFRFPYSVGFGSSFSECSTRPLRCRTPIALDPRSRGVSNRC